MSGRPVLAALDSTYLTSKGLVHQGTTTGFQRLHRRCLNEFGEVEYRHIPLNISITSPEAEQAFVSIPVFIVSYETMIHVGMTEAKATELWSRWINWPAHGPRREVDADDGGLTVTFKDFLLHSFDSQTDVTSENTEDWRECMNQCGIAVDVQDAILDPYFEDLFLGESCLYWVRDTIEMRFAGLESIQETSSQRDKRQLQDATRIENTGSN